MVSCNVLLSLFYPTCCTLGFSGSLLRHQQHQPPALLVFQNPTPHLACPTCMHLLTGFTKAAPLFSKEPCLTEEHSPETLPITLLRFVALRGLRWRGCCRHSNSCHAECQ